MASGREAGKQGGGGINPPPACGGSGRGECAEHDGMVDEHGHAFSLPLPLPQAGGVISSSHPPPAPFMPPEERAMGTYYEKVHYVPRRRRLGDMIEWHWLNAEKWQGIACHSFVSPAPFVRHTPTRRVAPPSPRKGEGVRHWGHITGKSIMPPPAPLRGHDRMALVKCGGVAGSGMPFFRVPRALCASERKSDRNTLR